MLDYKIYYLEFDNGVRFGKGTLEDTDITFRSDTLFSALYQEALKIERQDQFLQWIKDGKIVLSDAFPCIKGTYFLPKPMLRVINGDDTGRGNSVEKKLYKNMKFLPQQYLKDYVRGKFPREHLEDMKNIGSVNMKVSAAIRGLEEPSPYRVSAFYFQSNCGLYFLVGYEEKTQFEMMDELINSLSYRGLGGKKSAGLGRFFPVCKEVLEDFKARLCTEEKKCREGKTYILLSNGLPEEEELEDVMESASYSLLKRSGFVDSPDYAEQQMRKRDLYVFGAGSCFCKTFRGMLVQERNGGTHPIYRYERALFLEVDI